MRKAAFTLIELLAVIVIIAIIASIAIYSVNTIINQSRERSLTNTALSARRAISNYANTQQLNYLNNEASVSIISDSKPGEQNHLLELSKDPWGKDYKELYAILTNINSVITVDLYIKTGDNQWWYLESEDTKIKKLKFEVNGIYFEDEAMYVGQSFDIFLRLPKVYTLNNITNDFNVEVNGSFGNYEVVEPGLYKFSATINDVASNLKILVNVSGTDGTSNFTTSSETPAFNVVEGFDVSSITTGLLKVPFSNTSFQIKYNVLSTSGNPTSAGFTHSVKYSTSVTYTSIVPVCNLISGNNYECTYTYSNSPKAFSGFTSNPSITDVRVVRSGSTVNVNPNISVDFVCAPYNFYNAAFSVESTFWDDGMWPGTTGNLIFRLNTSGTSYYRVYFASVSDDSHRYEIIRKSSSGSEVIVAERTTFASDWTGAYYTGDLKLSGTITLNNGTITASIGRSTKINLSYTDPSPLPGGRYGVSADYGISPDYINGFVQKNGRINSTTCNDT